MEIDLHSFLISALKGGERSPLRSGRRGEAETAVCSESDIQDNESVIKLSPSLVSVICLFMVYLTTLSVAKTTASYHRMINK
jgi:hypothetical protein